MKPVIIAGGGVGGLTLALMLHDKGIPCRVYEAVKAVLPKGVGINALPHSMRELAALGLLPKLDEIGIRTRTLTYANHLGQPIWSEPRGLYAGHDAPQFSLHRGRLQAMLWDVATERLGPAAPCVGYRLLDYTQSDAGVIVRFQRPDGEVEEVEGVALVGADGIHSTLRQALQPDDGGIRWNGVTMWRGAVDWPAFDNGDAMVIAGDAVAKLVLYPIGPSETQGTRLTNWVIYARVAAPGEPLPVRDSWSLPGRYEDFRHFVARLDLPFIDTEAMIRATTEIFEYPMCDRDPLPRWTQGRVTLLGDAAHPMYPVGSNGASQAILDARCLADLLATKPVCEALAAYDDERRSATTEVVRSNRAGGPERVVDLIASRAPQGFQSIHDVATKAELVGIVRGYAQLAGFELPEGGGVFVVAENHVTDADAYKDYAGRVSATLRPYGGVVVARGGESISLEGAPPARIALIRFDSQERAKAWWNSEAYQALVPLRLKAAVGRVYITCGTGSPG